MAPPTDTQYRAQLITELGDTPGGTLDGLMRGLWDVATEYTGRRRAIAVAQRALTALIGELTTQARAAQTDPARVPAIRLEYDMRQGQLQTLATLLAQLPSAAGTPVAGRLTTLAPVTSPTGAHDANSTTYGGDPNARPWRVQR